MGENAKAFFSPFHQYLPQPAITPPLIILQSKDLKEDYKGLSVLQTINKVNLYLLNGSNSNDFPGQFSYRAGSRPSLIDHTLISWNLLTFVQNVYLDN